MSSRSRQGGDAYVYTLAPDGARAVLGPDQWVEERGAVYRRAEAAHQNYEHCLGVTRLQILLTRSGQAWSVDEFTADREHQDTRITVEVPSLGRYTVWPDATAILQFPSGQRTLYLFEIELSPLEPPQR